MERKALRTCAGCKWNKKRLAKCCRVKTESYCGIGQDYSHKKGYCNKYVSRFAKTVKNSTMEAELL